jgi:hypothetical protein
MIVKYPAVHSFLGPYSPELHRIEEALSKVKRLFCRAETC